MRLVLILFLVSFACTVHGFSLSKFTHKIWNETKKKVTSLAESAKKYVIEAGQALSDVHDLEEKAIKAISGLLSKSLLEAEESLSGSFEYASKFKVDFEHCKKKSESDVHAALEEILHDVTAKVKEVYRELKTEAKEVIHRAETGINEAKKSFWEGAKSIFEAGKSAGSFVLEGITLPATIEVLVKNTQKKVASRTASIVRDAQWCVIEAVKAAGVDASGLEGNEVNVELAEGNDIGPGYHTVQVPE
ncbi:uncharacterized protein LOC106654156 [Trichogramma pretiosum]|uniref:uncharacterized protein LOC106654156 n=1 Tax=Trichogramma pretiosum TaxID=7493 RepID=UPI0006C99041|nr:uncharacterized protein LOC106654156 [Trichogramma pretiosum]